MKLPTDFINSQQIMDGLKDEAVFNAVNGYMFFCTDLAKNTPNLDICLQAAKNECYQEIARLIKDPEFLEAEEHIKEGVIYLIAMALTITGDINFGSAPRIIAEINGGNNAGTKH